MRPAQNSRLKYFWTLQLESQLKLNCRTVFPIRCTNNLLLFSALELTNPSFPNTGLHLWSRCSVLPWASKTWMICSLHQSPVRERHSSPLTSKFTTDSHKNSTYLWSGKYKCSEKTHRRIESCILNVPCSEIYHIKGYFNMIWVNLQVYASDKKYLPAKQAKHLAEKRR